MRSEEGSILFGKYRVIKKIGEGSFAKVYLCVHIKLNTYRAIKCILKRDMLYEQLIREVNILRDVKHNNIPVIYDIEEDEDSAYIIEEYLEGLSLKEYILKGELNRIDKVIDFSLQICNILAYLHSHEQRILYLDLKPDNLIVSNDVIKLIDFGAAVTQGDIGRSNSYYGSGLFGSPEQKKGGRVDNKSDIYSFGKILMYMLEGVDNRGNKARALMKIAMRCISSTPVLRYKDMQVVEDKINQISMKKDDKEREGDYSPMKVCICESLAGIGAFEVSCLTMMSLKDKMSTAYVDLSGQGNIEGLVDYLGLVEGAEGEYGYNGCSIYKNYNGAKDRKAVVLNYGARVTECEEGAWDWDVVVCICRARFWDVYESRKLISYLNICEELRIVADSYESKAVLEGILGKDKKIYLLSDEIRKINEKLVLDEKQRSWIEKVLDNK